MKQMLLYSALSKKKTKQTKKVERHVNAHTNEMSTATSSNARSDSTLCPDGAKLQTTIGRVGNDRRRNSEINALDFGVGGRGFKAHIDFW